MLKNIRSFALQDADLELDIKDSKEIYEIIKNDNTIKCIFGSRYLSGKLKKHNYFVNELIQLKGKEETMTPIYRLFETDGKLQKVKMDQDAQVTGNCGWANKEAALKELTFRKTEQQIDVYKNFRSQMRDHVASYIEHTGNIELGKELCKFT